MDNFTNVFAFVSAGLRAGLPTWRPTQFWARRPTTTTTTTTSEGVQTSISFSPRAYLEIRPPTEENPAVTIEPGTKPKLIGRKRGHEEVEPASTESDQQQQQPKRLCDHKERFGSRLFAGRRARHAAVPRPPIAVPLKKRKREDGDEEQKAEAEQGRQVKRLQLEKFNLEIEVQRLRGFLAKAIREKEELIALREKEAQQAAAAAPQQEQEQEEGEEEEEERAPAEQKGKGKEKENDGRREARRKFLANRRVSFAAEATLHTYYYID